MAKTGVFLTNSLPRDGSHAPIQIGNSFVTADNTGTPQVSPLSYAGTVITIVVPDKAVEFIANPSTAMRIGEAVAMTQYDVIAAATKESIPCANMQNIYIVRDSASGTLNFRFTII